MGKIIYSFFDNGQRLLRWHALAARLRACKYKTLPWLLYNYTGSRYGCYLSPWAHIPKTTTFPHPIGVVIGEGCKLGEGCVIYQNVTLGLGNSGGQSGYPKLGDRVIVYANSILIGPIDIGPDVKIGAGSLVRKSVGSGTSVYGAVSSVGVQE